MITVRLARPSDALAIGVVHVAVWRSAYPGILPDTFLAKLSVPRQAGYYDRAIRGTGGVYVAVASGADVPGGAGPRIVGFATSGRGRMSDVSGKRLGDGEVETLYVLDDYRDRGLGRRLLREAALNLEHIGCGSAFVWVLRDNPSRWFYQRMGGTEVAEATVKVGGERVVQTAFAWDPIQKLLQASPQAS